MKDIYYIVIIIILVMCLASPTISISTEAGVTNTTESDEIRYTVETFEIAMKCPNCEDGELVVYGEPLPDMINFMENLPSGYLHKCNECNYKMYINGEIYPYIVYVRKEK